MSSSKVIKGIANITRTDLRCGGQRKKDPSFTCGKLLAKKNSLGQLCGEFKCERCGGIIEVVIS
jgi:hypothetical protein